MTHSIKKQSDTEVILNVTVTADDLAAIKQKTLQRLAKKVKAAGFREGKVPPAIAAKHIDPNQLHAELLEDAVNQFTIEVLDAEKLTPLDRPKVDVVTYEPNDKLEYTAQFDVIPEVKLGDYKKLSAKQDDVVVNDDDVNDVIDRMRTGMATKEEVAREAKNTDEVIIDFKGTDKDGKEVAGATGNDYPLVLGSNTFIPGFEEGLVGKKAGDAFDLPLTFPKDYGHKPLAGAKINFAIIVKAVKEVKLPEVNDEFAAACGPFKTAEELKADVRRELTAQKEREAVDKLKDSLIEQLVKGAHVPAPEVLIKDQMSSIERDIMQNLMYRGMTLQQHLEQQGLNEDEWRNKELRDQAIRRVQVGLCLAELSKVEDIQVQREELERRLQELMDQYGKQPEMKKQLDTPETRRDLANRILTEKTVDRLVELNSK